MPKLGKFYEFWYISAMSSMTAEQKKKLLKAKIAVALHPDRSKRGAMSGFVRFLRVEVLRVYTVLPRPKNSHTFGVL